MFLRESLFVLSDDYGRSDKSRIKALAEVAEALQPEISGANINSNQAVLEVECFGCRLSAPSCKTRKTILVLHSYPELVPNRYSIVYRPVKPFGFCIIYA